MDPFLEGAPEWQDFHGDFIYAIRQALVPQVRPRYLVRAQTQVYVLEETDGHVGIIIPVALDLLRGGERMPMGDPLPSGDYYAIISRSYRRPFCEVYAWTLRDPMPTIPVPLLKGDPDAVLNLQEIFTTVYERAGYDYSLDYTRPLEPPLRPEDADWVEEKVKAFLAAQRQGR
jgi:hypothetical protein